MAATTTAGAPAEGTAPATAAATTDAALLPASLVAFCEQNLRRAYDHAASERRRELTSVGASRITADAGEGLVFIKHALTSLPEGVGLVHTYTDTRTITNGAVNQSYDKFM
jgi:hypothetical protein